MNLIQIKRFPRIIFFSMFFCINISFTFSEDIKLENETDELKYLLSLDTGFTLTALRNLGFGIGVNYEHKLTDFLSIKAGLGHMACFSNVTAVTVDVQLFIYYYPLSNGLDKLYIGLGSGCDFIMYPNEDDIPDDTVISIIPILGWKWKAVKYLMVEPFVGWKYYVNETNNYKNVNNYLNNGFQWGINIKIFLPNRK